MITNLVMSDETRNTYNFTLEQYADYWAQAIANDIDTKILHTLIKQHHIRSRVRTIREVIDEIKNSIKSSSFS